MAEVTYKKEPVRRKNKSAYEKVSILSQQKDRYEQYWQSDLDRYTQNARALWGLNYGQWPSFSVLKSISKGKRPATWNILWDKATTFIGSVTGNSFDVRYSPAQGKIDSLALKLQDMYYSDRSLMDWETPEIDALLDSMSSVGFESMHISDRYHDLGNISFVKRNPRRILLSPSWKDADIYNLHDYITWGRFTVAEIKELFPVHSARIDELKNIEERNAINYGENPGGVSDYQTVSQKWGDQHLVIELHWIDKERGQWEYDRKNGCLFPETFEDFHSPEDLAAKMRYVQKMELTSDDITYVSRNKVTKNIRAICPSIDAELMLLDNADKVQVGSCNLFPIGIKMEGQYKGMVDELWDVQRSYNNNQAHIDLIQRTSAKNGVFLDKALADDDADLEKDIENAWNEGGSVVWIAEGKTQDLGSTGGIIPFPRQQVPNDIFTRGKDLMNIADKFSKVPAAMESRQEHGQEPNKMFENKIQVAMIGQKYYSKIYQTQKKQKAEAYARQAKITYSGSPREFGGRSGDDSFQINLISTDPETGERKVSDDISLLPDMKVTMVPSKDGINIRSQLRDDYSSVLQAVQGDPNNRMLTLELLDATIDTMPLPDDEKDHLSHTIQLLSLDARLQVLLRIKSAQAQLQGGQQPGQPGQQPQGQIESMGAAPQKENVPQQTSDRQQTEADMMKGTPQEVTA